MKIAVGIIALVFSMIALMQSCAVTGLSRLSEDTAVSEAGAFGILTSLLLFFGGAFAFALPRVASVLLVLGFFASFPARQSFPDMQIWGYVAAVLALLLMISQRVKKTEKST